MNLQSPQSFLVRQPSSPASALPGDTAARAPWSSSSSSEARSAKRSWESASHGSPSSSPTPSTWTSAKRPTGRPADETLAAGIGQHEARALMAEALEGRDGATDHMFDEYMGPAYRVMIGGLAQALRGSAPVAGHGAATSASTLPTPAAPGSAGRRHAASTGHGEAPAPGGRPRIDRSHLMKLSSVADIELALLQHYPVDELIARRPSSVKDVADLLEPHGYFVAGMDKLSLLRAFEAMCIKHIGPTAGADRITTAHALETLLRKGNVTGASFTSLESVQRHLLTLTPPRCATKLVIETLAKPGRMLEGLPLFSPRPDLPRVEATPLRSKAHVRPHE